MTRARAPKSAERSDAGKIPLKKTPKKKSARTGSSARSSSRTSKAKAAPRVNLEEIRSFLQLGQLRSEKCELKEARVAYEMAYELARKAHDLRATMEALSGLLRLAGEALDEAGVLRFEAELDQLMADHPRQVPPLAWYCKGAIARHHKDTRLAQRHFHRYLKAVRADSRVPEDSAQLISPEEGEARGWVMLAIMLWQRSFGHRSAARATWLAQELLRRYQDKSLPGVHGMLQLLLGNIAEWQKQHDVALRWYQKAHVSFLAEHNWFYHLYVLYGYARLARVKQNYAQAYWHLDLIDKAASGAEFGLLRREIATERKRLEQDAVDLLIDSRQCVIKTREGGQVSLRKQYVLLHILEALSQAHGKTGADAERGLSKAEIIETVWKESYRPEAHDNKLYYNINRLRKLIEPDIRNPQYLLNWKEGYRLAPGLRVHFLGGESRGGKSA